jgi:hypothetical protein
VTEKGKIVNSTKIASNPAVLGRMGYYPAAPKPLVCVPVAEKRHIGPAASGEHLTPEGGTAGEGCETERLKGKARATALSVTILTALQSHSLTAFPLLKRGVL